MRRLLAPCAVLAAILIAGCAAEQRATVPTAPFHAKVRRQRVGDETIAWYSRGSGPPLVLAIGTGSTMAEWDPALLRLLAERRRVIVFDYPGIGLSSPLRDPARATFPALADTLSDLMRAIGVPRADVVGWSMGGFVAQQLAIRHPERVRRVVLAATNPGGDAAVLGSPAAQALDDDPRGDSVLKELYPDTSGGREEGRRFLGRLDTASEAGEIPDDFRVSGATLNAQVAAEDPWLRSNANSRGLRRVQIPALVAGGTLDPVVPPVNLRRIAALMPRATLDLYAGGAHAFLFQFRERFAASLERFLAGRAR